MADSDIINQADLLSEITEKSSLTEIQQYIETVLKMRNLSKTSVQDTILLLLEEAGELAKAVRKSLPDTYIDLAKIENYGTIENEVADIFVVLMALCIKLDINLFVAFKDKEKENCERRWSK